MLQQEDFLLNLPRGCKESPRYTSLGHSYMDTRYMIANMEAPPTREGI